ncbi:uncharacterized protein LOC116257878 isoform X2 [Nymphaea colorata]|uniref:uncharacterized protein LOC116257878 isoform X2 n=1 Tax=Nymphaea colorata TaxID=210225 RepID=UPI00129DDE15|nr:uncharacterized protein LOC116257878 isoform X2 [Nymphaea colorata]
MDSDENNKGLLWKLPVVKSRHLGKLGPGFGYGAGCGVGLGIGLLGGAGLGFGIPGLQFGFGVGAGCGIGIGFGYGVGRGIAYDENRRYTNVGKLLNTQKDFLDQDQIGALVDQVVLTTKKLVAASSREIDKWRR